LQAALLIIWVPALIHNMVSSWAKPGFARWYWFSGLTAALFSLTLDLSVWSFVCLLFVVPFLRGPSRLKEFINQKGNAAFLGSAGLLFVCAVLIWLKLTQAVHGRVGQTVLEGAARLSWWKSGLTMFWDHLWMGVGLGNYPSAYLAYKSGAGEHTLYAHSLPI